MLLVALAGTRIQPKKSRMFFTQRALLRTRKNPLSASQRHSRHRVCLISRLALTFLKSQKGPLLVVAHLVRPHSSQVWVSTMPTQKRCSLRVRVFVLHESCLTYLWPVSLKELNKPEVYSSDEVKRWTTAQVLEWAKSVPGVLDEDIEQLRVNRITGTF